MSACSAVAVLTCNVVFGVSIELTGVECVFRLPDQRSESHFNWKFLFSAMVVISSHSKKSKVVI